MKKIILFSAVVFIGLAACSQKRKSPHETVTSKDNVKVTYGRPYKKGRDIFGALEPYGKVYRVGADEATEITFPKDGTFGGKAVKAGTYTLFAIPNADKWTFILNSQVGQWGAFKYDQYKDKDVLHTDIPVKKLAAPIEQLTIRFEGSDMFVEWDTTQLDVPLT